MWQIGNVDNEVEFTREQALRLAKESTYVRLLYGNVLDSTLSDDDILSQYFDHSDDLYYLLFNKDHYEHMDYVSNIVPMLEQLQVSGDITFGSLEGDNEGEFWGYRFNGEQPMTRLTGVVMYSPVVE